MNCVDCSLSKDNHKLNPGFFVPLVNTSISHKTTQQNKKCICVPSGRCHSNTLLGCPHNHVFINDIYTCQ